MGGEGARKGPEFCKVQMYEQAEGFAVHDSSSPAAVYLEMGGFDPWLSPMIPIPNDYQVLSFTCLLFSSSTALLGTHSSFWQRLTKTASYVTGLLASCLPLPPIHPAHSCQTALSEMQI